MLAVTVNPVEEVKFQFPLTEIALAPSVSVRVFAADAKEPHEHIFPLVLRVPRVSVTALVTLFVSEKTTVPLLPRVKLESVLPARVRLDVFEECEYASVPVYENVMVFTNVTSPMVEPVPPLRACVPDSVPV